MDAIHQKQLEILIGNQLSCHNEPPVTTHATFKLKKLQELLDEIRKHPEYDKDASEDDTHYVCISFVRDHIDKIETMRLYDSRHIDDLKKYENKKGGKCYSQLIPVISGCVCKLDSSRKTQTFKYLTRSDVKDTINIQRPGGEGTGLIPPPPPGN